MSAAGPAVPVSTTTSTTSAGRVPTSGSTPSRLPKIWEQMHLAWRYGADRIWIVNVGDIKPMEFPIQFFLDYAWDPERWPAERLPEFTRRWAEREFGSGHAEEIADIVDPVHDVQRAAEARDAGPAHLQPGELPGSRGVSSTTTTALPSEPRRSTRRMPAASRDAFYQLVLYPVRACAVVNDLYVTVGKNRLYAVQGRASANDLAERAQRAVPARCRPLA